MRLCRAFTFPILATLIALGSFLGCGPKDMASGSGPHITVTLVSDTTSVLPGQPFYLGVHFKPEPGWHVYWKNPGDSGLAPKFTWKAPEELSPLKVLWPYPERIQVGPLVNYGYGEVVLPIEALVDKAATSSKLRVELASQWLVCKDECIPGSADLSLTLPVDATQPPSKSPSSDSIAEAIRHVPKPLEQSSVVVEEQESQIVVTLIRNDGAPPPPTAVFFPDEPRIIDNGATQTSVRGNNTLKITLKRAANRTEPIERIRGVLVSELGWGAAGLPRSIAIDSHPEAPKAEGPSTLTNTPETSARPSTEVPSLLGAIVFALLGGLILNLMPCVFPVLSIKILGFVEHAGDDRAKVRLHGIAFAGGVIMSFWALAAILLTLRAGGEQLGWGFQLQSPVFIVAMTFVFFGLGILFLTDIAIGQTIQRMAGSSKLPTSYIGSYLNGVLATAVATPCTGPFMSSAIAATLTLPAFQSLLIFTSLGLGMSLPYLVLAYEPKLLRFLPRPGMWMETFKQAMAFPLFASVVWFVRIFARQTGLDGPGLTMTINVLWALLLVSIGAWLIVRAQHVRKPIFAKLYRLTAAGCVAFACFAAYPSEQSLSRSREFSAREAAGAVAIPDEHGLVWERYSPTRATELLMTGVPVYLDFTAEWCITCQANETVVFGSSAVRDLLKEKHVALLKGDWTSKDPMITDALKMYNRAGVPLNVLLKPGKDMPPLVFPNILTPGIVIDALSALPSIKEK